jgi:SAM-dependent methyltransferase
MKYCLTCELRYNEALNDCPACGYRPQSLNGFPAYAPELASAGAGFDAAYFPVLAQIEDANFWFRARNNLILWAVKRYCGDFKSYMEIGCGTGYVLSGIAHKFPNSVLHASEVFIAGLDFAKKRVPSTELMQMDARRIPYADAFDVIGAFDVVEHIKEDELVLAQVHKALKPGGHVLLTVPQHKWLWSPSDDYARHERRYSTQELRKKLEAAGFKLVRSTSFVSFLLPPMLLSRLRSKKPQAEFDPTDEFRLPAWLNNLFYQIMSIEISLIQLGLNFPLGGSRLIVAQKV